MGLLIPFITFVWYDEKSGKYIILPGKREYIRKRTIDKLRELGYELIPIDTKDQPDYKIVRRSDGKELKIVKWYTP